MRRQRRLVSAFLVVLLGSAGWSAAQERMPEAPGGAGDGGRAVGHHRMVVAAHPLAAEAGAAILAEGGSAVDAMVAVQAVLGLVEPQSSGLGGGAFVIYWDAATRALTTYDARETAPRSATPAYFLGPNGAPLPFMTAVTSGRSTGVPGVPKLLEAMWRRHGKLPWRHLFDRPIALATEGFALTPRYVAGVTATPTLANDPAAAAYFLDAAGAPKPIGTRQTNPALATSLRVLAEQGPEPFYSGAIARAIIDATRREPLPGLLEPADFTDYRVIERPAVCAPYRGLKVCGMGPPSSGGVAVGQMLELLEGFDLSAGGVGTAADTHLLLEAQRLAFADRARYLADPAFVPQDPTGLLDPAYLAERRRLIDPTRDMGVAAPGTPPRSAGWNRAPATDQPEHGTSNLAIIDAAGDALVMTTTVEQAYGSGRMVGGFLLNNQLTDFEFLPEGRDGAPVANRVEGGKRPRSSMAPTIVFGADGAPRVLVGSAGGSTIIPHVVQALVGMIDGQLDPLAAVSQPHAINMNGAVTILEKGTAIESLTPALAALGHRIIAADQTSGLTAIKVEPDRLIGAADPRREGIAAGN